MNFSKADFILVINPFWDLVVKKLPKFTLNVILKQHCKIVEHFLNKEITVIHNCVAYFYVICNIAPQSSRYCLYIYLYFAGQMCNDTDIRLIGSSSEHEGLVEICYGGIWGTVCGRWPNALTLAWNTYITQREASVICRQLGFPPWGEHFLIKCLNQI